MGLCICYSSISAAEIGFAWDGEQQGWICAALLLLRSRFSSFRALFLRFGSSISVLSWLRGISGVSSFWMSVDHSPTTYLFSPAGERQNVE